MSSIGRRFLVMFAILTGIASGLIAGYRTIEWLLPGFLGRLSPWLPEDFLSGLGYQFLSDLLFWVAPLAFAAVILSFSFMLRHDDLPTGKATPLGRLCLLAAVSAVVFAGLELLAAPWVSARLADLDFRFTQTRQLEDAYLKIKAQGADKQTNTDLETRLALLKRLGLLRPLQGQRGGNERMDYDFEVQILKAHFELDEFFKLRALPGVIETVDDPRSTVEELVSKAEQALAANDDREFQANLWGYQAYRRLINASDQGRPFDSRWVDRTKAVVDRSWALIYQKTLASDERKKASYFFRKGKSMGDYQFQNYLEAYYGFQELHREDPRDQEVAQFWELSRKKAAERTLFSEEMNVLFQVPGSENVVFLNRETPLEVIRIGKLLNTSQGVFVRDLEFLRMDTAGQVLLHWTAPYGRWAEDGIDFRVWDKDSPTPRFPTILTETAGNEFNPQGLVDPPRLLPRVSVRDLELVTAHDPQPQTVGTWDLMIHGRAIEALGYNSRILQTEFITRLAAPFGFFLVFLFLFAATWVHRARDPNRNWRLLVPLLPLLTEFFVEVGCWAARVSTGGLLQTVGFESTVEIIAVTILGASIAGVVSVHLALQKDLDSTTPL